MLARLIALSLSQRLLVLLLTVVMLAGGALALRELPIDAFPDVSSTQVKIVMKAPGMTPEEVVLASATVNTDFAETEVAPYAAQWDRDHTFPLDTVLAMGELGLFGLMFDIKQSSRNQMFGTCFEDFFYYFYAVLATIQSLGRFIIFDRFFHFLRKHRIYIRRIGKDGIVSV